MLANTGRQGAARGPSRIASRLGLLTASALAGALAAVDGAGDGDVVLDAHALTSIMTATAKADVVCNLLIMGSSSGELS